MTYLGLEFSYDELMAFRSAMDETPLAAMLTKIDQRIRDDSKIMLQMTSKNIEEIRVIQGVVQGMTMMENVIQNLLTFDVDAFITASAETHNEEEEDAEQPNIVF